MTSSSNRGRLKLAMTNQFGQVQPAELVATTKRLLGRYLEEVVLPLGLCPWAEPALRRNEVETVVLTRAWSFPDDVEEAATSVSCALVDAREDASLVFVVLPRLQTTRLQMDDILRTVRARGDRTFALAAFHPDAPLDTASPERLIPFLRRSPDPMIQAVRHAQLEKLAPHKPSGTAFLDVRRLAAQFATKTATPTLRQQIAEDNMKRLCDFGLERVEELLLDIHEDRRRSRPGVDRTSPSAS